MYSIFKRVFANYEINTKYIITIRFNPLCLCIYYSMECKVLKYFRYSYLSRKNYALLFLFLFLIFSIISIITIKSKCLLRRYFSRYFESLVVSSQSLWIHFIDVWNILDRLMNPYEPTKHDAVLIHFLFHYHLLRKSDYWNTAHCHYQQMPYRNFRQQKDF